MGNGLFALHGEAELGDGGTSAVEDMVEASQDVTKLKRALVAGGLGEAAAAMYLALFRSPAGLFLRSKFTFYAYYAVAAAFLLFGAAEAWIGVWVSHEPRHRRAVGMTVLWLSVLPIFFLARVAGSAILK